MKSALAPYFGKRDFKVTSEPQGGKASKGALSFVIQKHAASRLHYDFRLELDGTLKSWAVPKGPSLDPGDKRMAVHVEDHPIDYGRFEGTIPKGQYGAGEVIVWDNGTWEPVGDPRAGYRAGKLKFRLDGKKLHGGWTLVRMHGREGERQEPWLLIKEKDEAARPSAEYSVVDAEPKSVLSDRTIADRPTAAAKEAARDDSPNEGGREEGDLGEGRGQEVGSGVVGPHRGARADRDAGRRGQGEAARDLQPAARDAGVGAAERRRLALRDQVRRLSHRRPRRRRRRSPVDATRQRLVRAHARAGRGGALARPRLGLARRRDRRQRRERHARLQRAAERLRLVAHRRTSSTTSSTCRTTPATTCAACRWSSGARCSPPRSTARRRSSASASARTSTRARRSCSRTRAGCASRG